MIIFGLMGNPLKIECGVHGEFTVDGWQARPSAK